MDGRDRIGWAWTSGRARQATCRRVGIDVRTGHGLEGWAQTDGPRRQDEGMHIGTLDSWLSFANFFPSRFLLVIPRWLHLKVGNSLDVHLIHSHGRWFNGQNL